MFAIKNLYIMFLIKNICLNIMKQKLKIKVIKSSVLFSVFLFIGFIPVSSAAPMRVNEILSIFNQCMNGIPKLNDSTSYSDFMIWSACLINACKICNDGRNLVGLTQSHHR